MSAIVRAVVLVVGVGFMLGGLGLTLVDSSSVPPGLWLLVVGAVLTIVPLIERNRYRSAAAERDDLKPGPGGGETSETPLEPRFVPTTERFVDPTSGHAMRVLVDPRTGERRYVSEI